MTDVIPGTLGVRYLHRRRCTEGTGEAVVTSRDGSHGAPQYRIERAEHGYRVVGPNVLIWEPTLGEAVERREELQGRGWRRPVQPRPQAGPSPPYGAIAYGPVLSRRLGHSLGLNLTPVGYRVCNFECVYCEYRDAPVRGARWPTPDEVGFALARALAKSMELDSITISGHGEPTLHPRFPDVVDRILSRAGRARPGVPVRILTNGSRAAQPAVRVALERLDERIVKLDAVPERTCRPSRRAPLGALFFAIGQLADVTLQSCFVEGESSNTARTAVREWADLVLELEPRAVQIYTIDRQPARADVRPASADLLEEIACELRARTGIEAQVCP